MFMQHSSSVSETLPPKLLFLAFHYLWKVLYKCLLYWCLADVVYTYHKLTAIPTVQTPAVYCYMKSIT